MNIFITIQQKVLATRLSRAVFLNALLIAGVMFAPFAMAFPPGPPGQSGDDMVPFSTEAIGECNNVNCFFTFPEVPSGKMLVITYINVWVRPVSNSTAVFDFAELATSNTVNPSNFARIFFPMAQIGYAGSSILADTWGGQASLLAYVRAGSTARLTLRTSVPGEVNITFSLISGYLMNAP